MPGNYKTDIFGAVLCAYTNMHEVVSHIFWIHLLEIGWVIPIRVTSCIMDVGKGRFLVYFSIILRSHKMWPMARNYLICFENVLQYSGDPKIEPRLRLFWHEGFPVLPHFPGRMHEWILTIYLPPLDTIVNQFHSPSEPHNVFSLISSIMLFFHLRGLPNKILYSLLASLSCYLHSEPIETLHDFSIVTMQGSTLGGSHVTTAWRVLRLWMEGRPPDTDGSSKCIE